MIGSRPAEPEPERAPEPEVNPGEAAETQPPERGTPAYDVDQGIPVFTGPWPY